MILADHNVCNGLSETGERDERILGVLPGTKAGGLCLEQG